MALHWKQVGKELVADSEYGVYKIGVLDTGKIGLTLRNPQDEVLLTGVHKTIGEATDRADEDLLFRQRAWETL